MSPFSPSRYSRSIEVDVYTGFIPGLATKLAVPRVNSWEAARLPVPHELAHGNQSFSANTGLSRNAGQQILDHEGSLRARLTCSRRVKNQLNPNTAKSHGVQVAQGRKLVVLPYGQEVIIRNPRLDELRRREHGELERRCFCCGFQIRTS